MMFRSPWSMVCIVVAILSTVAAAQTTKATAPTTRPNIVLILADDLGYSDISCFGSEIHTPRIDSIGHDGVTLTTFYNQARCCPTRASIMTGKYPHQVGIGAMIDEYAEWMRKAANTPNYSDHLADDARTMADLLRAAGYHTMMSGKWHLGPQPQWWPVHRGFDRSFVQVNGAMNYFGGWSDNSPRALMAIDDQRYTPPHDGFYSTDAFADHAIEFLNEAKSDGKPFFLYLPFNASHWPLQAPADEIARHKGQYDAGWQETRIARLARQKQLGLVPADQELSAMDRGNARPWDQLADDRRAEWERRMEIYAAQTEHLDAAVGRVLDALHSMNLDGSTVVVFCSDNGGAAEDPHGGKAGATLGDRDSFRGYDRPWATVSNTPWRHHKVTAYEGGISTPLLVRFPSRPEVPQYIRTPASVLDLLPTFLELAHAPLPSDLEGQSLLPLFNGKAADGERTFCWEHEGNRAIRRGNWKLVALADPHDDSWELYDLSTDRIESHDLAKEKPQIVQSLLADYNRWADRVGVVPWSKIAPQRPAKVEKHG